MDTTGERFPITRSTLLQQIQSPDPETRKRALGTLIQVYWRPVYGYLRLRWGRDRPDAEDLTQEFFLRAMEGNFFERYDSTVARFRTFLRTCLDGFMSNTDRAAGRKKRGGGNTWLSLDFDLAESELAGVSVEGESAMDRFFHQEWVRSVLTLSVSGLKAYCESNGKSLAFEVFSRYDIHAVAHDPVNDPEEFDPYALRDLTAKLLAARFDLEIHVNRQCQSPCGRYAMTAANTTQ